MNNSEKTKILLRLHGLEEYKLLSYSADCLCKTPRKGYEHEFIESRAVLELLTELVEKI